MTRFLGISAVCHRLLGFSRSKLSWTVSQLLADVDWPRHLKFFLLADPRWSLRFRSHWLPNPFLSSWFARTMTRPRSCRMTAPSTGGTSWSESREIADRPHRHALALSQVTSDAETRFKLLVSFSSFSAFLVFEVDDCRLSMTFLMIVFFSFSRQVYSKSYDNVAS